LADKDVEMLGKEMYLNGFHGLLIGFHVSISSATGEMEQPSIFAREEFYRCRPVFVKETANTDEMRAETFK
jgi:hypothetical protein